METPGQHQGLVESFGRSLAADQSPAADQQAPPFPVDPGGFALSGAMSHRTHPKRRPR